MKTCHKRQKFFEKPLTTSQAYVAATIFFKNRCPSFSTVTMAGDATDQHSPGFLPIDRKTIFERIYGMLDGSLLVHFFGHRLIDSPPGHSLVTPVLNYLTATVERQRRSDGCDTNDLRKHPSQTHHHQRSISILI